MNSIERDVGNPEQEFLSKLGELEGLNALNVSTHNFDESLLSKVEDWELAATSELLNVLKPVGEIYASYMRDPYTNWDEFWSMQSDNIILVKDAILRAAENVPGSNEDYRNYLLQLASDFEKGLDRDNAPSDIIWHALKSSQGSCSMYIRLSPKLEMGTSSYSKPDRIDGGDTSSSVRIRYEQELSTSSYIMMNSVADYLDAKELMNKFSFNVFQENVIAAGGMHGAPQAAASAHNYRLQRDDGSVSVVVIFNQNIQSDKTQKLLQSAGEIFSKNYLEQVTWMLSSDAIDLLCGHETAEAIIEAKYKDQLSKIGRREAVEILANLTAVDSISRLSREKGDYYHRFFEYLAISMYGKMQRELNQPESVKAMVYRRGYKLLVNRLKEGSVFEYDTLGKVTNINIDAYADVVGKLSAEILQVIQTADIRKNNELFEIERLA